MMIDETLPAKEEQGTNTYCIVEMEENDRESDARHTEDSQLPKEILTWILKRSVPIVSSEVCHNKLYSNQDSCRNSNYYYFQFQSHKKL